MNRPKKSLYERIADSYGNYTVERGLVPKEEGPIQAYGMLVVLCNGTTYLLILLVATRTGCVKSKKSLLNAGSFLFSFFDSKCDKKFFNFIVAEHFENIKTIYST